MGKVYKTVSKYCFITQTHKSICAVNLQYIQKPSTENVSLIYLYFNKVVSETHGMTQSKK